MSSTDLDVLIILGTTVKTPRLYNGRHNELRAQRQRCTDAQAIDYV